VYVERPCDIQNRLTVGEQLRCDLRLIGIELPRPTEADAALLCRLAAGTGPLTN